VKRWMMALLVVGLAMLVPATIAEMAPPAKAASLVQVTNFGNNPTNLQMYIYVPNNVQPNPPILLALHGCQGSGPYLYSSTAFASLADQYGFIVIYPSVTASYDCWDVTSSQALTRNGGSDPVGLMSMITYTEQHYGGNPNQVYVTGESSGAMMTNVMLADYPDVFKAGAAFMGVPYYCFYTGTVRGWNSACAQGQVSMSAQAWGNLARNADPGYSGPRPRVQLWHGTADTTLNYENLGQEILQWTNVTGVSSTPTTTTTPQSGWTETQYDNASGVPQVEAFSIAGAGHQLPIPGAGMEAYAIHFFGLDGGAPPPPPAGPITAGDNSAKCVDDSGLSTANGNKIQLWDCNGGANQSWTVEPDGTLRVYGKCMDITGANYSNGTNIDLWDCNGGANQQWQAQNGALVNPASGKCLDDPGFNTANGTQLDLWACNGGTNQKWTIP
jgi:poly(hydroxyalkanoate) depolymerase family esterase